MTHFVFDENLPPRLAKGMSAFGEEVHHLTEFFGPGTRDEDWLPRAGRDGWAVVTHDHRIRRRPREASAYRAHRVGAFFLLGRHMSACEMVQTVVRNWPRMKRLAGETKPPFLFVIPSRGTAIHRLPMAS